MSNGDSVQKEIEERKRQKQNALDKLSELSSKKIEIKRPVFFVPGWTDESCVCWKTSYLKSYTPIKDWISSIAKNGEMANFVTFSDKETKACSSFLDLGDILKTKIWDVIGNNEEFDLVGHSMGGLDSVAAITDNVEPLKNVHNLITVATPHQGSELGEIGPVFRKYERHHALQCLNLDPDQPSIKLINKLDVRKRLLENVNKLYCLMGTRDMAVMRSARFNKEGIDKDFYKEKVEIIEFGGATHSQKYGITQDPRVILAIINLLIGIEPEKPKYNYGYIYRKV